MSDDSGREPMNDDEGGRFSWSDILAIVIAVFQLILPRVLLLAVVLLGIAWLMGRAVK